MTKTEKRKAIYRAAEMIAAKKYVNFSGPLWKEYVYFYSTTLDDIELSNSTPPSEKDDWVQTLLLFFAEAGI